MIVDKEQLILYSCRDSSKPYLDLKELLKVSCYQTGFHLPRGPVLYTTRF